MKRLVCEMCGGTDLIKQDGVFACQSCGCKYSVEEARKMMVEVAGGVVEIKNAAQLENLLNLARSSFESENFARAEEFCNQVIAMDDKNYEAWKLKGEAINYQIGANNQRILEAYNCLMTSYRVSSEEEKESRKYEVFISLKECFEGEIKFWLKQVEVGRPTNAAVKRAKEAYADAYYKLNAAFDELDLGDAGRKMYLTAFANLFILLGTHSCISAWETTVGYNYYRDYMGAVMRGSLDPFDCSSFGLGRVLADVDAYRPTKRIWDTFIEEADNLISLLQYAEELFNDETDPGLMGSVYGLIAYIEEHIVASSSWKIVRDGTSVGWCLEWRIPANERATRQGIVDKYEKLAPLN